MDLKRMLLALLVAGGLRAQAPAGEPFLLGQTRRLNSSVLKEARSYHVHLPASYGWAKDQRYPLLLVLDGATHFVHTAGSVGHLAAQQEIPEMIVVALDSTVRVRDFTQSDWSSHWIGGGGAAAFRRFLATELLPALDRAYRTNGFRILSGHSAGGQFALYCLGEAPSLFQATFAFSPSLDWDDELPRRDLEKALLARRDLQGFLYVAYSDDSGRALAQDEALVATLRSKAPAGLHWHAQSFPQESHSGVPLLAQIDALRRLYAGYRLPEAELRLGLAHAEAQFKALSKRLGWPMEVPESVLNSLGYDALERDQAPEALALFRRSLAAYPQSANGHDSLADALEKAGQWEEAAKATDRAVALARAQGHPNLPQFEHHARKVKARLAQGPSRP